MKWFERGGVGLHWREDGDPDGRPLVFSNSLGTDLRLWDQILPLLPSGWRIIRYDTRGHGLSDAPGGAYALSDLVADVAGLMDSLSMRDATFVGLSLGGVTGQALAVERPDLVRALVLSNSAARMGTPELWDHRIDVVTRDGLEPLADGILDRWFGAAFRARPEVKAWRAMVTRTPAAGYAGCCHALKATDLTRQTATLRLPTLAIAGTEDGASPPDVVKATADLIPGSQFVELTGAGHLPCAEDPVAYASVLKAFLEASS